MSLCKSSIHSRAQVKFADPHIPTGTLLDEAKHQGNVQYKVWSKMKGIIQYRPVILDPNTAHKYVTISEDLSSVSRRNGAAQVPDNPERGGHLRGSEGFSSGTHSWEVEVGGYWAAGVTTVTGDVWGIYISTDGKLYEKTPTVCTKLVSGLLVEAQLKVLLDYDQGKLSLYALKRKTHVHTITHCFTEPVFPWFQEYVKILPVEL